eukprot:scaffold15150_cov32-Tisochrysis_lutea.AAC.5
MGVASRSRDASVAATGSSVSSASFSSTTRSASAVDVAEARDRRSQPRSEVASAVEKRSGHSRRSRAVAWHGQVGSGHEVLREPL